MSRALDFTDEVTQAIEGLLARANGARPSRTLSQSSVRACAEAAASSVAGLSFVHAGERGDPRSVTTVCLCVRTEQGVVVGVRGARAQDVDPSRVWSSISHWHRYDDALNRAHVERWARVLGVDQLLIRWVAFGAREGEEAYLEAIARSPSDDHPRLVYADWLTERGDVRGEFISVQCALAQEPPGTPRAAALRERERQLLAAHAAEWVKDLPEHAAIHRFERGFVSMLRVKTPDVVPALERFVEREGVWRMVFECAPPSTLAVAPWVSKLRVLEFTAQGQLSGEVFSRLLSRALPRLEVLSLRGQRGLGRQGLEGLSQQGPAVLRSLRHLQLEGVDLTAELVERFTHSNWFNRLEVVSLADNPRIGARGVETLAAKLGGTWSLQLAGVRSADEGAKALACAPGLGELGWLSLDRNRISAGGARALVESTTLRSLKRLSIDGNLFGRALKQQLDERFGG